MTPLSDNHDIGLDKAIEAAKIAGAYGTHFSPLTIGCAINPDYEVDRVHIEMDKVLRQACLTPGGAACLSIPVRIGKSQLGIVYTAVWYLDLFPTRDVLLTTGNMNLAEGFGKEIRDAFKQHGPSGTGILRHDLDSDSQSRTKFKINSGKHKKGGIFCVGVGGAIMGVGGDLLLSDDTIVNAKEAEKPENHEAICKWYVGSVNNRRHNENATRIISGTRWDPQDLIGFMLEYDKKFVEFKFPAICMEEEGDILGRSKGEVLSPSRFSYEHYMEEKRIMEAKGQGHVWWAMYQQAPYRLNAADRKPEDIHVLDREQMPALSNFVFCRSWDFGGSSDGRADPTVGGLFAFDVTNGDFYVLDIWRAKRDASEVEAQVIALAEQDVKMYGNNYSIYIEQEGGSSGKHLTEHYKNIITKYHVDGVPTGNQSKLRRATPFLSSVASKKVYMLRADWNETFMKEYLDFPHVPNDDQIDVSALAFNMLSKELETSACWSDDDSGAKTGDVGADGVQYSSATWGGDDEFGDMGAFRGQFDE